MAKNEEAIEVQGTVTEALPNGMFSVELADGRRVVAHIPGMMRVRLNRLLPGDRVIIEVSPYDMGRGRIKNKSK